jgi:hypothetical protein
MAIALHRFNGMTDMDSPDTVIPKGYHRTARNGIFRGNPGNYRWESVYGTTAIPNPFLPVTGVNKNIGRHYDPVNQQLFHFNYNSTGLHGIYIYSTVLKTWQRLIQTGTNTTGDPLAFNPFVRIHSIDILYGDGNSGNLLFFIDSLQRPRKLNIQRLLAGTYTNIKDSFLKVIKAPPIPPPICVYENDTTVNNNNLINSLFNFSCGHIYDDYENSVLGSGAIQPLPSDNFNLVNTTDKSRNARIAVYVPTGDQNVKKIRIYGKQTSNGVTTDWFIITDLIKADMNIPDNSVYRYLFFNNGNYVPADPAFTVLDFDYVPQNANTEALINGNVITYGGITEGYNFFTPSFGITTANVQPQLYSTNGTIFFAAPNGLFTGSQPQITLYVTGVGTNDAFGNPNTLEKVPATFTVRAKSGLTNVNFTYTNTSNSVSTMLSGLQAAAVAAGWTFVSSGTNSITIYYPTGNVVLQSSYQQGIFQDNSPSPTPVHALLPKASYAWGVLYRDIDGRTNGVISNLTGNMQTLSVTDSEIPEVLIGLNGFTPPLWAAYYEIVRTDNLTYQKREDWVSTSAYSNTGALVANQYAYLGINNFSYYNTQIGATEGVVGYSFTPGDRVNITGLYNAVGFLAQSYSFDYAILGLVVNPVANGQTQMGTFIQIAYPTNDIIPGAFVFDGTSDFQNYKMTIYSYKAQSASNENVFFQIGQQYGIGNPGTLSAYHMGNVGDGQVNITDGDYFMRQREVPVVNEYYINCGTFVQNTPGGTLWTNPGGGAIPIVNNAVWEIVGGINQSAGLLGTEYPQYSNGDYIIWNKSITPFNVRLRQSLTITDTMGSTGQWSLYVKTVLPGNVVSTYAVIPLFTGALQNVANVYTYDVTLTLPAGAKLWLVSLAVDQHIIAAGPITLDVIRNRTIFVFDPSFSDIYNLVTNSDNKPNVIDTTALQTFYSTLFRFSQTDVLGTDINNSNRFYFNNFDEFDKSFGSIVRMRVRQRELRIFQQRRCGRVGIYSKFIKDNTGVNQLVTTDSIITPNNIQYFEGEYGIGNQPDSLASSGYVDYFSDPVKGYWCRLSLNGIEPISELYKVQTLAGTALPYYLNQYNNQFGGYANVLAAFNFCKDRDGEVIFVMQSGTTAQLTFPGPSSTTLTQPATTSSGPTTIPGQSIAFNESKNSWTSEYDIDADSLVCCENLLYSFSNGVLYSHDNATACANFYGTQYPCYIDVPFNDNLVEKKTFLSLDEVSQTVWECPSIYTNQISYGTTPQQSTLVAEDFALLGSNWSATFWRDKNSQLGQFNGGATLKGNLIVIRFQTTNPASFVYLTDVSLTYIDSRRTNR